MNSIVKATIFWWTENKKWEGIFKSEEEAKFYTKLKLNIFPADENTEIFINETMYSYGDFV